MTLWRNQGPQNGHNLRRRYILDLDIRVQSIRFSPAARIHSQDTFLFSPRRRHILIVIARNSGETMRQLTARNTSA